MCQFGAACTRPVCFFAHGEHQLRQTDMPGGPQPVVAPPEPVPSLNGGFGSRDLGSPIDPAVKQQQQLIALQAAAAGFSQQQQHQQQHQQQQAAAVAAAAANMPGSMDPLSGTLQHVNSYQGLVDTSSGLGGGMNGMGGGMGMGSLQNPLGHLSASSPLSAPLPQLSADVLAALQNMGSSNNGGVSPMGGHPLMHQRSSIPASAYTEQLPAPGRLQRSLTAHPAVNAAAAAAAANENSTNLNELTQQLALMQLMQGSGGPDASGTLPDLNSQSVDQLLGFAQLQQQQQQQHQQAAAAAAAAAVTAGLDLGSLLPVTSSGYGHSADGSMSCPLPPVFGAGALSHGGPSGLQPLSGMGPPSAVSGGLPRVPTAPGSTLGAPVSPAASDNGRDAPSPVGANGRDTQVPAPGKKGHRWSAPVSPSNSTKGGNDLAAAADGVKLTSLSSGAAHHQSSSASSSTSSAAGGSNSRLQSMPSDNLARNLAPADSISFSTGLSGGATLAHATGAAGSGSSSTDGAALLMVGDSPLAAAQVQAALCGGVDASKGQPHSMGHEKAAELLANLPEDAVQKLLALVQQGGSAQQQQQ